MLLEFWAGCEGVMEKWCRIAMMLEESRPGSIKILSAVMERLTTNVAYHRFLQQKGIMGRFNEAFSTLEKRLNETLTRASAQPTE
jgi:hypothetical protein